MTEKKLIENLNNLNKVSPDSAWLKSNRELFLTQIANSGADKISMWQVFYINVRSFASASTKPVFASFLFLLLLISSTVFGHKLFSQAKPNDTLYIARVISEKARLNTVFDAETRDKLAVKFAAQHAQEISAVLSDPNFNNEENEDEVAKLNESFGREIETVKNRMASIASRNEEDSDINSESEREVTVSGEVATKTEDFAGDEGKNADDQGVEIASEDLKDDKGIAISINSETNTSLSIEDDKATSLASSTEEVTKEEATKAEENKDDKVSDSEIDANGEVKIEESAKSGNTNEEIANALLIEVSSELSTDEAALNEVKKLFQEKNYDQVIERLNEISKSVD